MRLLMYAPSLEGWKQCLLVSFIQTAIERTLNVVRQAEKAGIMKIVVTGTFRPSFCWNYCWRLWLPAHVESYSLECQTGEKHQRGDIRKE
jgi:hypothetical protein